MNGKSGHSFFMFITQTTHGINVGRIHSPQALAHTVFGLISIGGKAISLSRFYICIGNSLVGYGGMAMLGAYLHEWRRDSPSDEVVLRYEIARLTAMAVNEPQTKDVIDEVILALKEKLAGSIDAGLKAASLIEAHLISEQERVAINATLNNDLDRAMNYHGPRALFCVDRFGTA